MWLTKMPRRMFIATKPADLRRSFDGLAAMVEGFDPGGSMSGDLFAFFNKRRTQVRMLFWDGSGYWLVMKRLEAGTFRDVFDEDPGGHLELDNAEMAMLLEGVDADKIKRRRRYRREKKTTD
ncbi:MAG: IS66 family insertion sequence element accessory protein TnpB [Myxococcales bacterium]|nr:IS66 family insertion sequence element accessory protein TnpB [Myxococcales bacterium]